LLGANSFTPRALRLAAAASSLCVASALRYADTDTNEQGHEMRFSYTAVWEDTVRLIRAHGSLAAALAGVFLLLPGLLFGHFLPIPTTSEPADLVPMMMEHYRANAHWMLLSGIVTMAGTLAILLLVFRPSMAVGGAIAASLAILPFYFIANLLTSIALAIGFVLLFVPGLYLLGRLVPLPALMVAENRKNPIDAIRGTWALTKGHGWAVLGLFLLVFLAGFILTAVVGGIINAILHLALPDHLAAFLSLFVSSLLSTILQIVAIFLYAAIYRALSARAEGVGAAADVPVKRGPARITGTSGEGGDSAS
jgi:hypothetical protein